MASGLSDMTPVALITSLLPNMIRCSGSSRTFPVSDLVSVIFPRSPGSFQWKMIWRVTKVLEVLTATGVVIFFKAFSAERHGKKWFILFYKKYIIVSK